MKSPIFIGGTGRCGSTVLVRILGRHPAIHALRWESQLLVAPGGLLNLARRGFPRGGVERFVERLRGPWFRRVYHPGSAKEYEAGLAHDVTEQDREEAISFLLQELAEGAASRPDAVVREFADHLFAPVTRRRSASRWCEKTPRNVLFVQELAAAFPDMKFVHVIRDGRDVAASMVARGFWPIAAGHEHPELAEFHGRITFEKAAAYWVTVLALSRKLAAGLPADRYRELRFEDLIADPITFIEELCSFLGEEVHPALFEQGLSRHNIGRWRQEVPPQSQTRVAATAGPMLSRLGYAG